MYFDNSTIRYDCLISERVGKVLIFKQRRKEKDRQKYDPVLKGMDFSALKGNPTYLKLDRLQPCLILVSPLSNVTLSGNIQKILATWALKLIPPLDTIHSGCTQGHTFFHFPINSNHVCTNSVSSNRIDKGPNSVQVFVCLDSTFICEKVL